MYSSLLRFIYFKANLGLMPQMLVLLMLNGLERKFYSLIFYHFIDCFYSKRGRISSRSGASAPKAALGKAAAHLLISITLNFPGTEPQGPG